MVIVVWGIMVLKWSVSTIWFFIYVQVIIIVILLTLFSLLKQNSVQQLIPFLKMISFLGVSKAVLDNVIFCHQEESNWSVTSVNNIIFLLYCTAFYHTTMHCIVLYCGQLHIIALLSALQPSLLSTPLHLTPFPL